MSHGLAVVVIGSEPPVCGVLFAAGVKPPDSGFTVIWDDAPFERDLRRGRDGWYDDPRVTTWCLHCLIDDHPEIGHGLDLARVHGQVDLEDGVWVVSEEVQDVVPRVPRRRLRGRRGWK